MKGCLLPFAYCGYGSHTNLRMFTVTSQVKTHLRTRSKTGKQKVVRSFHLFVFSFCPHFVWGPYNGGYVLGLYSSTKRLNPSQLHPGQVPYLLHYLSGTRNDSPSERPSQSEDVMALTFDSSFPCLLTSMLLWPSSVFPQCLPSNSADLLTYHSGFPAPWQMEFNRRHSHTIS